jgi:NADH-quinone oxidoreductase subunit C
MEKIQQVLESILGQPVQPEPATTPVCFRIPAEKLMEVCEGLHRHPELYFDSLSCLTGLDNGPQVNTMEVVYTLYSIPFHRHVNLKVVIPREKPEVESVASIWRTAEWHEREAYDMLGIVFNNHPDLRRILLPADWEGFPLRKDYQHQETYRGITVKYHNT